MGSEHLLTPSIVIVHELVQQNLELMVRIAGRADRLRPHCKTHKMSAMVRWQQQMGIQHFKAATVAEVEMLAREHVTDVFLAYPLVGPNIARVARLQQKYPDTQLLLNVDRSAGITSLGAAMSAAGHKVGVVLDLDVGMHRTGAAIGDAALRLYQQIDKTPGLTPAGLHVYDGHRRQATLTERLAAVREDFVKVLEFRDRCVASGCPVPRLICGGTPTFPAFAQLDEPTIELSPGTCVFADAGYGHHFPDLGFTPAAVMLTRVVSIPEDGTVTCDLGYKSVASDPPMETRVVFPQLPDMRILLHSEEHLTFQTAEWQHLKPGDVLIGIPWHICPTIAMHRDAVVVRAGRVVDRWEVTARDRVLSI